MKEELTKDLHFWCIGMRPRGLGLLLMLSSLQYCLFAAAGDKWPLTVPFGSVSSTALPAAVFFTVAFPLIRRRLPSSIGLRLRKRALFSGSDPDESSSMRGCDGARPFFRAAERVTGAK